MKFHREGIPSLALVSALFAATVAAAWFVKHPVLSPVLVAFGLFLLVVILQFFRLPKRQFARDQQRVFSPADGKVVVIEEVNDTEYFSEPVRQISVFMSPTNVHANWFPTDGEVVYSKYHPGLYLVAWHPKSSTDNERHSIVIKHDSGHQILVKQIAGALARRIVNYASIGTRAKQGNELGFIKFGSRVDVLLPLSALVKVKLGQTVTGGITELAELR